MMVKKNAIAKALMKGKHCLNCIWQGTSCQKPDGEFVCASWMGYDHKRDPMLAGKARNIFHHMLTKAK